VGCVIVNVNNMNLTQLAPMNQTPNFKFQHTVNNLGRFMELFLTLLTAPNPKP
jgi:hypothetical protein